MNKLNSKTLSLVILGILILSLLFVVTAKNFNLKFPGSTDKQPTPLSADPILQNQTASIDGKVIKVEDNYLTIVDLKGKTSVFKASKFVSVSKFNSTSSFASSSAGLSKLELDKQALISLKAEEGEYRIISISYLPPLPSPPPVKTTPRATLRPSPTAK